MVLHACTSDDVDNSIADEKVLISFARPVMYGVSRAVTGEIDGVYPENENFMIYGKKYDQTTGYQGWATGTEDVFAPGGELMTFKDLSIVKGWFPQTPSYFEHTNYYSFAGYSPADLTTTQVAGASKAASVSYSAAGLQIKNYDAGVLGVQTDLMYAPRMYNISGSYTMGHSTDGTDNNTNKDYDGVNLVFKHALSSVHFKTCVDPDYVQYKQEAGYGTAAGEFHMMSIKINQVASRGTFHEGITSEGGSTKTTYAASPEWKENTVYDATYTFLESKLPGGNPDGVAVPLPKTTGATVSEKATDITELTYDTDKKGCSALLVPQTINADAEIVVTWKQTYRDDVTGQPTTELFSKSLKLKDITTEWEIGYRYTYTIVFKANSIYFTPTVTEWTNQIN